MFIYLVTNLINGKAYVGETIKPVQARWKEHLYNARKGFSFHLYRAIRKYGEEAFEIRTLAVGSSAENLNHLEKLWILMLGTHSTEAGYNMTYGGDGVTGTDEVKEKIRQKALGRPTSDKQKSTASSLFKGVPKSIEQRQKIAAHWDPARKQEQAEVARRVNEAENSKLKDYTCPDCGQEFSQVKRGVYGGHRKACLHWQKVEKWLEESDPNAI